MVIRLVMSGKEGFPCGLRTYDLEKIFLTLWRVWIPFLQLQIVFVFVFVSIWLAGTLKPDRREV